MINRTRAIRPLTTAAFLVLGFTAIPLPAVASSAAASTCSTRVVGGGSGAPGAPPKQAYAHARATCNDVHGLKLQMTLYRNGVKVGSKQICQDGPTVPPVTGGPKDLVCEVNEHVTNPAGTQNWQVKATTEWYNTGGAKKSSSSSYSFRL
ncbi:hypothetical protein ABZ897_29260 [Nonomuraea sp. NPDC046802]|uniref:hypothetical protein n=1 Tax=Nonomuraea sp. NPDC046802 TaxID=3154919 RepID=UPI0033EBB2A5